MKKKSQTIIRITNNLKKYIKKIKGILYYIILI